MDRTSIALISSVALIADFGMPNSIGCIKSKNISAVAPEIMKGDPRRRKIESDRASWGRE